MTDAPFVDRAACLAQLASILSAPPAYDWIDRVTPVGTLVCQFVLPLHMCKPQNQSRRATGWQRAKERKAILTELRRQFIHFPPDRMKIKLVPEKSSFRPTLETPLTGRPLIRCIRVSSVAPDAYADWGKTVVDCLTVKSGGLGILKDDSPKNANVQQRWEPGKKGHGFVVVEVWTGEDTP